jgi:hypothetical protein
VAYHVGIRLAQIGNYGGGRNNFLIRGDKPNFKPTSPSEVKNAVTFRQRERGNCSTPEGKRGEKKERREGSRTCALESQHPKSDAPEEKYSRIRLKQRLSRKHNALVTFYQIKRRHISEAVNFHIRMWRISPGPGI